MLTRIENCDQTESRIDIPSQSPLLEIMHVKDRVCNLRGDHAITVFMRSPRIGNDETQPITCSLYPKDDQGGGYLFELSPQLGCMVGCDFCGCGEFKGSLTPEETNLQIQVMDVVARELGVSIPPPYQINFTDGGELLLNNHCMEILEATTQQIPTGVKLSTVLPDYALARNNLDQILQFMSQYEPRLNLQVSLYSTDPQIRQDSSGIPLMSFADLRVLGERAMQAHPDGRKITLTFTLKADSHCVPAEIAGILPPELFFIRLHPYKDNHNRATIETMPLEDCRRLEQEFRALGYTDILREEYDPLEADQLVEGGTRSIRDSLTTTLQ